MARVSNSKREPKPVDEFSASVREYKSLKDQIDELTKRQKSLRDYLMDTVEQTGFEDENGNVWVELDDEIDGVVAIKRERRAKPALDEDAAAEVLSAKGLDEECYKTVRVVDEDAVMACLYDERLTEDDIDTIFPQKVTWALVLK